MKPAYTVIWKPSLIDETIAEFVIRAIEDGTGAAAIASAMSVVEARLASRPFEEGESRSGIERVTFAQPLMVTYEIHETERIVYVLRAQYFPRRT
jgi:hypothetical protein